MKMSSNNVEDITTALADTRVSPTGVSFQNCSLKLNSAQDAQVIVDAITSCTNLEYLNLEGNTLGIEAAEAIAKALEKHPEIKRALWKDLFTGRLKSEIPLVLAHLGNALVTAGARLIELDLSDNAFGPIGVEGLASLLRSPSCYNLQELRLNNNGLGIAGGKLLANALIDCYRNSKEHGQPLALKVFIAGRNRLENDGARALSKVFAMVKSLEEIAMPQNGIYHPGISALSDAFKLNKNLQILNLNDNTIGPKGCKALADALPSLQNLRQINFGDCLLKSAGALHLARALEDKHPKLEDVTLNDNEIKAAGGLAMAKAMHNKKQLKSLNLGANQFGSAGRQNIETLMKSTGQFDKLESLSEDESDESEEENAENDSEESGENSESETEEPEANEVPTEIETVPTHQPDPVNSVSEFLSNPSSVGFLVIGENRDKQLLIEAQKMQDKEPDVYLNHFVSVLMKVGSLSAVTEESTGKLALSCSDMLYNELFSWLHHSQQFSLLNNILMVYLGLIKSEEKKFKITWNIDGCMLALESAIKKKIFPSGTRDTLKMFLNRVNLNDSSTSIALKKLHATVNNN